MYGVSQCLSVWSVVAGSVTNWTGICFWIELIHIYPLFEWWLLIPTESPSPVTEHSMSRCLCQMYNFTYEHNLDALIKQCGFTGCKATLQTKLADMWRVHEKMEDRKDVHTETHPHQQHNKQKETHPHLQHNNQKETHPQLQHNNQKRRVYCGLGQLRVIGWSACPGRWSSFIE